MKDKTTAVVKIYKLCDPRIIETWEDESVKYIGITTTSLNVRFGKHLTDSKATNRKLTYRENWIKGLLKVELKPTIHLIEEVIGLENGYEREIYWIKYYRELGCKLTNLSEGGEGFTGAIRSKKGKRVQARKNHQDKNSRKIYQFTRDGEFVNSYDSFSLAEIETGVSAKNIHRFIRGESQHLGGFLWSLTRTAPQVREDLAKRKVDQYDQEGNFIKTWPSVRAAAKAVGVPGNTISMIIHSQYERNSAGGFLWTFAGEPLKHDLKVRHTHGIDQYTVEGEFVKHWDSLKEAAEALNANKSSIGDCARGINQTAAGGFVWKFTIPKIN